MTTHRSYVATVEEASVACGRGGIHLLSSYCKFQGILREECWDLVKKGALCRTLMKLVKKGALTAALIPGSRPFNGLDWANFKLSQKWFLKR